MKRPAWCSDCQDTQPIALDSLGFWECQNAAWLFLAAAGALLIVGVCLPSLVLVACSILAASLAFAADVVARAEARR